MIRSPNIWDSPEVYELENEASDRAGVIDTTLAALHPITGSRLLDIGCGAGFHLPRYASMGADVLGIEPHLPLVAKARERLERTGSPARVAAAAAEQVPLADDSVDVAVARWAYFFGAGCEPGLAELERGDPAGRGRLPHRQRRHPVDLRVMVHSRLPSLRSGCGATVLGPPRVSSPRD